ncbi:MAG: N-acetyltransferase [Sandaracinobacter sp.]
MVRRRGTRPDVTIVIAPVETRSDRRQFVDLAWKLFAGDPMWRPPLKSEVHALIGGAKSNPWFLHGRAAFFLARRNGEVVGRISAQVCDLVQQSRPGLGQWGFFDTIDDEEVSGALIAAAEAWLRAQGMTRAQGPISLSIWDEPGLLVSGFDTPPRVMMGHHLPWQERLVLAAGYAGVKDLHAWTLPIDNGFPETVNRIMALGERNAKIRIREVELKHFDREAKIILDILNQAWGQNWGFVPLTDAEVVFVGKKLKPIVYPHLVRIAEYEGEPVAFMITLPDINELTQDLNGRLLPFGWAKLLWRLRRPRTKWLRVPLMGVLPRLQGTRTASLLAFMLIEYIRRDATGIHGARFAEIGWILDDNGPMISIADAVQAHIEKTYRIYERDL